MPTRRKKRSERGVGRISTPTTDVTFAGRLGAMIRQRRTDLGYTIQQLADRTNGKVSMALISTYEKGTEPGISKFLWLCVALECQLDDLLPVDARLFFAEKTFDPDKAAKVLGLRGTVKKKRKRQPEGQAEAPAAAQDSTSEQEQSADGPADDNPEQAED